MTMIDEVSKQLGSLEASSKSMAVNVEKILNALDSLNRDVIIQGSKIVSAHKRVDVVELIIDKHEVLITNHENLKNKSIGAVAAAGSFGGLLGYLGHVISDMLF